MSLVIRQWKHPEDDLAVQHLAQQLWPIGLHPGGLAWETATDQLPEHTAVAERDGRVVAWAGIDHYNDDDLWGKGDYGAVHGADLDPEAGDTLLAWVLNKHREHKTLSVPVYHGDEALASILSRSGFTATGQTLNGMFHPAAAQPPTWPEGYRARAFQPGEETARVEVHKQAWQPATMPWPEHLRDRFDPASESRFSAARFTRVRATLLYTSDLDLVVEAPDGTLAACCTVWFDATSGCAEIEPLGVAPEHRRRGLATCLVHEVCARVGALGGREVYINSEPSEVYPTPALTYRSAGFTLVDRARWYTLPR